MNNLSIKKWSSDDRPREKLISRGVQRLSDSEILGLLIGSGIRNISAVELGRQLLAQYDNNLASLGRLNVHELTRIKGIGKAKAVIIVAAFELGRRSGSASLPERAALRSSADAFRIFMPLISDIPHEEFWIIYLNKANRILETYNCSKGGISGTVIDIKIILRKGMELLASSIIVGHNHPSGNRTPSDNDLQITKKLSEAALHMDIKLLDHLIIAGKEYYSFADEGMI